MDSGNGAGLPVTLASEFRRVREQGEIITLPTTGRRVRMRTVKPSVLLEYGKIPDPLTDLVIKIMYGTITPQQYREFFDITERKEHALDLARSLCIVCKAALLDPRIVSDEEIDGVVCADDEILIDDLEDGEQRYIFDLALLEATRLSRFRREQEAALEPVPSVEAHEQQAE